MTYRTDLSRSLASLPPGTVVSIPVFLFYRHKGVVSERSYGGKPMVIACSAKTGKVQEETWDAFAEGKDVTMEGHLGRLHPLAVVQRARGSIGKRYDLFVWNCEHFVFYAHGLEPQSPQLATTGLITGLCLGLAALNVRV